MDTGYVVVQLAEALHKPEGHGFDSRWCLCNFSLTQSFWPHYGPAVNSASNINEYQEYFLGGKGDWCIGLTSLPLSCTVLKSGSLNLLEMSGPVQACNGNALPLLLSLSGKWHQRRAESMDKRLIWGPLSAPFQANQLLKHNHTVFLLVII